MDLDTITITTAWYDGYLHDKNGNPYFMPEFAEQQEVWNVKFRFVTEEKARGYQLVDVTGTIDDLRRWWICAYTASETALAGYQQGIVFDQRLNNNTTHWGTVQFVYGTMKHDTAPFSVA